MAKYKNLTSAGPDLFVVTMLIISCLKSKTKHFLIQHRRMNTHRLWLNKAELVLEKDGKSHFLIKRVIH